MKYILLLALLFTAAIASSQEKVLDTFFYNKYDFYNIKKNKMAVINWPVFYLELFFKQKSTEKYGEYDYIPFGFDTLTIVIQEKIRGDSVYYIDYGITKIKLDPEKFYSVHKMYIYKEGTYMLLFYDDRNNFLADSFIIVQN